MESYPTQSNWAFVIGAATIDKHSLVTAEFFTESSELFFVKGKHVVGIAVGDGRGRGRRHSFKLYLESRYIMIYDKGSFREVCRELKEKPKAPSYFGATNSLEPPLICKTGKQAGFRLALTCHMRTT